MMHTTFTKKDQWWWLPVRLAMLSSVIYNTVITSGAAGLGQTDEVEGT
jgi:hypothetical protein